MAAPSGYVSQCDTESGVIEQSDVNQNGAEAGSENSADRREPPPEHVTDRQRENVTDQADR